MRRKLLKSMFKCNTDMNIFYKSELPIFQGIKNVRSKSIPALQHNEKYQYGNMIIYDLFGVISSLPVT